MSEIRDIRGLIEKFSKMWKGSIFPETLEFIEALEKANKQLEEKVIALRPNAERVKELEEINRINEAVIQGKSEPLVFDDIPDSKEPESQCEHDWISFSNKVATGMDVCLHCKALKPTQEPSDDWVSVEDRLPELSKEVLVWTKHGEFSMGYRIDTDDGPDYWVTDVDTDEFNKSITHWQPLPAPPVENKDER